MTTIFISHRNKPFDNRWADEIKNFIQREKGIGSFLDFDVVLGLEAGEHWEDEIYAAMNRAQVVIALITPEWLDSDWCLSEARMAKLRGIKLIPLKMAKCEMPFKDIQHIDFLENVDQAWRQLQKALSSEHKLPHQPYPGLASFNEKDAAVFFGRDEETRDLLNKVNSLFNGQPDAPRMLLVLGSSGSGKSSLVRAGLLPVMKAEEERYFVVDPNIPRGDPLNELGRVLDCPVTGNPNVICRHILEHLEIKQSKYDRTLITIDQAEELLRHPDQIFFEVLRLVMDKGRGRIIVLATMRSDFLNEFQQSELLTFKPRLKYSTFTLDPMPEDRLSDVIRKPAQLVGQIDFEDDLVAKLLQDHGGPDALPLLAYFLNEFWCDKYIADKRLTLAEYNQSGGLKEVLVKAVAGALNECEDIHARLDTSKCLDEELRDIFLGCLVDVSSTTGEPTRKRGDSGTLTPDKLKLLKPFVDKRLLVSKTIVKNVQQERTFSEDNTINRYIIEIAHETLLRQWTTLADWIKKAKEELMALDRLKLAAEHWVEQNQNTDDLTHSGNRLAEVEALSSESRYVSRFTITANEYLNACRQKEIDTIESERSLRKTAQNWTRWTFSAAIVASIGLGFAGFKWKESITSTDNANLAKNRSQLSLARMHASLSQQEADAGNATTGILLALQAIRSFEEISKLADIPEAWMSLYASLNSLHENIVFDGHHKWVVSAQFSPDGTHVLTASGDSSARVWNGENGTLIHSFDGHTGALNSAIYNSSGARVVTASHDSTIRIWNVEKGTLENVLTGHKDMVLNAIFSPDDRFVLSVSRDNTARLWNAHGGQLVTELIGHSGPVVNAAFSPDGMHVVTASHDETARIWTVPDGKLVADLRRHSGPVNDAVFNPNGTQIATASDDGEVHLWSMMGNSLQFKLARHTGSVRDVGFSPDGKKIVTASSDNSIRLWSSDTGRQLTEITGHENSVKSAFFSIDGELLVTASSDASARLWSTHDGQLIAKFIGHEDALNSASISPDGERVLTSSNDGTARLWSIENNMFISKLDGRSGQIVSAKFSVDGKYLVTSAREGSAQLWDLAENLLITQFKGHTKRVSNVDISLDGNFVLTASDDHTARLWSTKKRSVVKMFDDHSGPVTDVKFSPDGTQLATASTDGTARLWSIKDGHELAILLGHSKGITSVDYSRDGKRILTASIDSTARVWNALNGKLLFILEDHADGLTDAVFSPDDTLIVTTSSDHTARLWRTNDGELLGVLEGHENWVWNAEFNKEGTLLVTASMDGTARVWDVRDKIAISVLQGGNGEVYHAGFSPDGAQVVTGSADGLVRIWNAREGTLALELERHEGLLSVAKFHPDGSKILTSSQDGIARLWKIPDHQSLINIALDHVPRTELTVTEKKEYFIED